MENNVHNIVVQPNTFYDGTDTYVYGYKLQTTFWQDFIIAEQYGINAIKDTYRRAMNEWKHNYKYLTELVMVLNWRIWHTYKVNIDIAHLYDELWRTADAYACENLKGEELEYFYRTTD